VFLALLTASLVPASVFAQTAGIAGVVKDASGGVMPGVTVEASSPALIEKTRTVVTDGEGQYKIVDLRAGLYTVTFTLPGFNVVKREGIELTAAFTATVNAEMRVGGVEETITVSGQSPLIDTQSVTQRRPMTHDVIDDLPTGRTFQNVSVLVPGVQVAIGSQDVGGTGGERYQTLSVHGSRTDQMPLVFNNMPFNNMNNTGGGYNTTLMMNTGTVQEMTVNTGGLTAEQRSSGVLTNIIPKEGSNLFHGYFLTNFAGGDMQSDNLTQSLIDRGLKAVNRVHKLWDLNPAVGGPLLKDRLWVYGGFRYYGAQSWVAGMFRNKTPLAPQYCAAVAGCMYNGVLVPDSQDLNDQALDGDTWNRGSTINFTWQATPKNKTTLYYQSNQRLVYCNECSATRSPEAATYYHSDPQYLMQATWSNPYTSRLLFEGGATFLNERWFFGQHPAITNGYGSDAVISKTESSINVTYGSATTFTIGANHQYNMRLAANYVTGSHAFKIGMADMWGSRNYRYDTNQAQSWTFTNGVPTTITQYARPQIDQEHLKAALAVYAQDRWTLQRLTLNLGVRFDYHDAYVPAQAYPAILFVGPRTYDPISDVPSWKDLSPRLGGTYDVFGDGRTVARANYAKYLASESTNMATLNNPVNTSINSAQRRWTDNGNFVPDCNLANAAANGECGALSVPLGALNIVTHYDPAIINGWGVRPNDHEVSLGLQRELVPGMALDFQFTRHTFGNFFATQNRALPPALAYSSYCVSVPSDSRLPGGGGNQICGFMDVNPAPYFGASPDNYTTRASNFGTVKDAYTGYDVNATARLARGGLASGGVSIGHEVSDICAVIGQANVGYAPLSGVIASSAGTLSVGGQPGVPSTLNCHVQPPFQPDAKALITYPLPWWGLTASATIQSRPGPQILASFVVSTNTGSTVQPVGLNRALSLGTATTQLVAPGTMYGDRVNQVDVRFGKIFKISRARIRSSIDVYNLLNTSAILAVNTRYSTTNNAWLTPTQILQGRLLKLGAQVDF